MHSAIMGHDGKSACDSVMYVVSRFWVLVAQTHGNWLLNNQFASSFSFGSRYGLREDGAT